MAIWDFGRFMQTLIQFDVMPGSQLIKPWLGQENVAADNETFGGSAQMGKILVVGGDRPENRTLVQALLDRSYQTHWAQDADESLGGAAMLILCADLAATTRDSLLAQVSQDPQWRSPQWELFNFRQATPALAQLWGAVDDVVMGGVSQSQLRLTPTGALFTGNVSTDNNGGFASVRTKSLANPWDLSKYAGFRLRVKGDGQRYKFIARCENRWDGIGYSYSFETTADQWLSVDIPFSELVPVFRAKSVPQMGQFQADRVYALQLMLSKFEYDGQLNPSFQPGLFQLAIEAIAVYGGEPFPQIIALSQTTAPQEALQETGLPYCLIHCPQGFTAENLQTVINVIGDRQAVNQIITCAASQ
ncbi:CIA30 family protein [Picosynechococcus sp. PCC 8807]|uniref:CIA30 family protein n=1 Tax=Picosynechococcus sp. PCC 8807 TaxID=195248 RepID=UPI0008103AEE|nr:CIA30 family protein [Picosynechococcus sp. PCC 8807]ANV90242.1 NADH:ubiquinone oxidoreductase complex I intermediate-associated protein 30 [Picosynechococcus sp. PCC 8807]